jgi:hypothetical protein
MNPQEKSQDKPYNQDSSLMSASRLSPAVESKPGNARSNFSNEDLLQLIQQTLDLVDDDGFDDEFATPMKTAAKKRKRAASSEQQQ